MDLAVAVPRATVSSVSGSFQRHSSPRVATLSGSPAGGRWGPAGAFPVLYVGRPTVSVTVEAYRHLVDDVEGMTGDQVGARTPWTCKIAVTNVLDLREGSSRDAVGLTLDDLASTIEDYDRCQRVGQAAYQLQLHGTIAPSAGGNGETLALFEHHLSAQRAAGRRPTRNMEAATDRPTSPTRHHRRRGQFVAPAAPGQRLEARGRRRAGLPMSARRLGLRSQKGRPGHPKERT